MLLFVSRGVHTFSFFCLASGAGLHRRVLFSLPARRRASSRSLATARTPGSRAGTSAPTAGSWYVLAGTARQLACAAVPLSRVTPSPAAASPSPRASAAWTTGSPSISLPLKPSAVRKVRASRSRRTNKEISLREMDLTADHWAGAHSRWDRPLTKATSAPSLSPGQSRVPPPPPSGKRSQNGSADGSLCLGWACVWIKEGESELGAARAARASSLPPAVRRLLTLRGFAGWAQPSPNAPTQRRRKRKEFQTKTA